MADYGFTNKRKYVIIAAMDFINMGEFFVLHNDRI